MSSWVVCCPGPSFFACVFVIGLRKAAFNFSYKGKADVGSFPEILLLHLVDVFMYCLDMYANLSL